MLDHSKAVIAARRRSAKYWSDLFVCNHVNKHVTWMQLCKIYHYYSLSITLSHVLVEYCIFHLQDLSRVSVYLKKNSGKLISQVYFTVTASSLHKKKAKRKINYLPTSVFFLRNDAVFPPIRCIYTEVQAIISSIKSFTNYQFFNIFPPLKSLFRWKEQAFIYI